MHQFVAADRVVVVEEYLQAAAEGDMRLFMMNGQPLRYQGKFAAFRRLRSGDAIGSNIRSGGESTKAVVAEVALRIAEIVRPKLVEEGMFLIATAQTTSSTGENSSGSAACGETRARNRARISKGSWMADLLFDLNFTTAWFLENGRPLASSV
jgi:glutathione synthetase-like protein